MDHTRTDQAMSAAPRRGERSNAGVAAPRLVQEHAAAMADAGQPDPPAGKKNKVQSRKSSTQRASSVEGKHQTGMMPGGKL